MEGYDSFVAAVNDAARACNSWKYLGSGEIFTRDELLALAKFSDGQFEPDDGNYYVTFPDGEIGLFSTVDGEVERLFLPVATAAPEPASEPAPFPKFCRKCGAPLDPGAKFCRKCGNKIQ